MQKEAIAIVKNKRILTFGGDEDSDEEDSDDDSKKK